MRCVRSGILAASLLVSSVCSAGSAIPSLDALIEAFRCELVDRLERIHAGDRSAARDRYVTVWPRNRPEAYVQCIFHPGDESMLCEAASGAYRLRPGEAGPAVPVGEPARLRALGFAPSLAGGNDRREVALGTMPDFGPVADLILTALHDGYGVRYPVRLQVVAPKAPTSTGVCRPIG